MAEQWLEQWLREGVITLKQTQTWCCLARTGRAFPPPFKPHPLCTLTPTPPHPTPFRWAGLTRQLYLAVLPEGTRASVQIHHFPGETRLLATRECRVWSPELWLSLAGLESGVTDCLWRQMPGSLILIMIDGKSSQCYYVLLWHEIKDKPHSILR